MQERRRVLRKPLAVMLEMFSANGSQKSLGKGFTTNLSESGLAMETSKTLYPGDKVRLQFSLPNEWKFDILGEIMYARDGVLTRAYGARFFEAPGESVERLKDYLTGHVIV